MTPEEIAKTVFPNDTKIHHWSLRELRDEVALAIRTYASNRQLEAVVTAAANWWRNKRPEGWTQKQHLAQPFVNTTSDIERELAMAVANLLLA